MRWSELPERLWNVLAGLLEQFVTWLGTSGVRIALIVVLAGFASFVLKRITARLRQAFADGDLTTERAKRADTLAGVVRTVGGVLILTGSTMMILREVGLDIGPMLAAAGIGGLALGFGAQSLVKDLITGFFVLIEDQVRVGDVVEIGGKTGVVEGVSLRTIRLRDMSGTVHSIPNSKVEIVSNMTRGFSRYVVDIPVAENADPKQVFGVLQEIGDEMNRDPEIARDVVKPLEILGLESPTKAPVVKAQITTHPRKQWRVGRELNFRIRKRFGEVGIELR